MSASGALAQDGEESEEDSIAIEVAAVSGQEFEGQALGNFIPAVIGGEGDLLFVNRGPLRDVFLTFDSSLDLIGGASPTPQLNVSFANYSIDARGDTYALATAGGVFTGSVGDDQAEAIEFADTFPNADLISDGDGGNLLEGALPLVLGGSTAILISDVSSIDVSGSGGFTEQDVVLVTDAIGEFVQLPDFQFVSGGKPGRSITSLGFSGVNGLFLSQTPLLSSANSGVASSLQRVDVSSFNFGAATQVGPLGNPQQGDDFLRGGQPTFDGFTFDGFVGDDGLTALGQGVQIAQGEFSANSQSAVFVLNNALAGLDGGTSPDVPANLLALDDQVIAVGSTILGVQTQTTVGAVNFIRFEDVLLSESGEVFFRSPARLEDGSSLDDVSLWKITNPGEANQTIAPVLTVGEQIRIPEEIIATLFPEGNGDDFVTISGFVSPTQERVGTITSDGRPRFYSVNASGMIATVVQISTVNGDVDAIVAQDENGFFQLVSFIGQTIEIGANDFRTVSGFTAQFGSNDVDGAGDLYNDEEQLGFIVSFTDFSSAVVRVSLNGREVVEIREFLWDGACGDDEFFTRCPDVNWVNNADPSQRADAAPGVEPGEARAIIRGADVRIAAASAAITSIDSDGRITIQNGQSLTLSAPSVISELEIEEGAVVAAQPLETERLTISGTASAGNITTDVLSVSADLNVTDAITVSTNASWSGGNISGDGAITLTPDDLSIAPTLSISGTGGQLTTEVIVEAGEVQFADSTNISIFQEGRLKLTGQSTASFRDTAITGSGQLVLEEGSSLTANGQSLIAADIIVRDATMATLADTNVLLVGNGGRLVIDNLTFTRSDPGAINDDTFGEIAIGQNSELVLSEGHTLEVDDRVRVSGAGAFTVDGALNLTARAVFHNDAALTIDPGAISGDGVFINSGALSLMPGNESPESSAVINVPFAVIDNGSIALDPSRDLTFETDVVDAINSPVNLVDLGLETLGVEIGDQAASLPDVSVLLAPEAAAQGGGGNAGNGAGTLSLANSLSATGTGALFVAGNIELDDFRTLLLETDLILAGSFAGSSVLLLNRVVGPDEFTRREVVIPDTVADTDFTSALALTFDKVDLSGLSSAASPASATLKNEVGEQVVRNRLVPTGRTFRETYEEVLDLVRINQGPLAQFTATETTIANLSIVNTGLMDLRGTVFEEGTVRITNSGFMRLQQPVIEGDLEIENKESPLSAFSDSAFELSGTLDGDQRIASLTQTGGRVTFAATGGTVTVGSLMQNISEDQFPGLPRGITVFENAALVIEESNLLLEAGALGEVELSGEFTVQGDIDILRDGKAPEIIGIGAGGDIFIGEEGRLGSINEDGSGLIFIEGKFQGAGRFGGDSLAVRSETGRALFDSGVVTKFLDVEIGARLSAELSPDDDDTLTTALEAQTANIAGVLDVTRGRSLIATLNIGPEGSATFAGDVEADIVMVDGTLMLGDQSNATLQDLKVETLTVSEQASFFSSNGEVAFRRATIDGSVQIDALSDDVDVIQELTIGETGRFRIAGGGTLTKLEIAAGGLVTFADTLTVTDAGATTIDGLFQGRANASFAGDIRVGAGGSLETRDTISGREGGIITATGLFSEGLVRADQLRITGNTDVFIARRGAPSFDFGLTESDTETNGVELFTLADLSVGSLELVNANLVNTGAIVVDGARGRAGDVLVVGRSFAEQGYQGSAGSYISINGSGRIAGGLTLGASAAWSQFGNLTANGFYRGARSSIFFLSGSTNLRGAPPQDSTGIAPNRSLARVLSLVPVVAESNNQSQRHEIEGGFFVTENAEFDGEVWVSAEGILSTGGNLTFDTADIEGTLLTSGTLTANSIDLSGTAQFGSGVFGSLAIAQTGQLIGNDFSLTGDFTNLGTFVLGSLDDGPGQFSVGGEFVNAGVFSGTGTINGSVVQETREGGPDASGLLFSPGFSPGILNIAGDATFDAGMVIMEIGGLTPGTEHDQINVEGMLTFGSQAMLVIDLLDTESGEPFLLGTGDEVILFTAADISPDDVEQINFTVLDELPVGFALVADIATSGDGEILRVLRGFSGSTLADLSGLNISQAGVAEAIDFLSTSESGVPSQALFDLALELQFADTFAIQSAGLTELGATTLSALQSTTLRAGRYNMDFMTSRLAAGALMPSDEPARQASAAGAPAREPIGGSDARGQAFSKRDFARVATGQIQRNGGVSYFVGDGARLSLVGAAAVHFGDQDSRGGTVGFDQDGWSASLGVEYQNADGSFLIGGAATLGESDADLDGGLGEGSSESTGFGLYTAYDAGVVRIGAAISATDLDLETLRAVRGQNASGESDGDLLALHAQIYAPLLSNDTLSFGPKVAFDFQHLEIDALTEAGAGDFSLNLPDMDRKASAFTLGAAGDFGFDLGQWDGALSVDLGYQITTAGDDFIARAVAFSSAPGTRFAAALRPLVNDGVRLRSGLSLFSGSGIEARAVYDGFFGQNGQNQNTVQVQMSVSF